MSWLYFANRLIELPLGIVGVAMGTVLVPELTRALRGGDKTAIAHAELRALELAVGLALPATLGLIALSQPIVRLLFEHGAFTAEDTIATARALVWLALGLPAQVLVKALSPAFFAREDTMTPLVATARGSSLRSPRRCCSAISSARPGSPPALRSGPEQRDGLIRRGSESFGFSIDAAARRRLPRIVAAALLMGAALWLAAMFEATPSAHGLVQGGILLGLIAGWNCDLRRAAPPVRRDLLARDDECDPADVVARLARLGFAWQTTAPNYGASRSYGITQSYDREAP